MTVANLQTDVFEESALEIGTLYTDAWLFEPVVTILTADLSTDEWLFTALPVAGELPVFAPSLITSVTRVQQNIAFPQFVMGGQGLTDNYALFKKSATYGIAEFPIWRSPVYRINQDFDVMRITFPLHLDLTAGVSILPKLYFDDETNTAVGTLINTTNYSNDNKLVTLTSKSFGNAVHGQANFFLELQFLGDDLAVVGLPITIDLDISET